VRTLIEHYFRRWGINLQPAHRAEYISMLMSLVASTGGLVLAPVNTRNFLTRSVISRPLAEEAPSVDLVLGHHRANTSPVLKLFPSRTDELVARVSKRLDAYPVDCGETAPHMRFRHQSMKTYRLKADAIAPIR
jgi:LysR family transcriptional regulator, hca operon transcriptional activator